MAYTQVRHTTLGLTTISIRQVGDLYEGEVKMEYDVAMFSAKGIFSSEKEAFHWAYGLNQANHDDWAGYASKEGILLESKPPKTRKALVYTVADALKQSQRNYDNFMLGKSSTSRDNVSLHSVKASKLSLGREGNHGISVCQDGEGGVREGGVSMTNQWIHASPD